MEKQKKNILDLTAEEARKYMLQAKQYCSFRVPEYFKFENALSFAERAVGRKDESQCYAMNPENGKRVKPSDYDGVNFRLYSNKDGKLDYRPLTLINPFYYYLLVRTITSTEAWEEILDRFAALEVEHFHVASIPIVDDENKDKETILYWWGNVEQKSIELSLKYKYMFVTDITNCYGSIYTHSIAWAIMGKEKAKQERLNKALLGNRLDNYIQGMQNGQTNGIPQGNIVSDLMAELILAYADSMIAKRAQQENITDYFVIRYRDDYRVFSNNRNELERFSLIMQQELADLNFKINSSKTSVVEDLIVGSIKPDKVSLFGHFFHRTGMPEHENLKDPSIPQKELLAIYSLSKKYPNSGSIERLLGDFYDFLTGTEVKNCNWKALTAILVAIAKDNPRTYAIVAAIISLFIEKIEIENSKELIEDVYKKVMAFPNSSILLLWLQRITIKTELDFDYHDPLCNVVAGEDVELWNNAWLDPALLNGFSNRLIISMEAIKDMKVSIDKQEVSPFYEYLQIEL